MTHPFSTQILFVLGLLACFAVTAGAVADSPPLTTKPQVIKVQGTDLTGLNAMGLSDALRRSKEQGVQAVIVDLGGITHMTDAGMDALVQGARLYGMDRFAVANLSGNPAVLAENQGAGRFQTYPSVEAAISALRE